MWPRADGTPDLLERQTEGLAQDVRAELHACVIAWLEPVLDGLPQVIIAHVEIWAARWHRKQLLIVRLVQPNELACGGRHVAGRVVRVEVILLVRRKIREDAWPIALLQHVFAVVGAVDLDSWFHKVHACDAIPANDHGHHDAWIELRSVCAEKGGAVHAFPGAVHPMPEVLRVLEILAFVDLFITEEDSLQVQCWQRGLLAQADPITKPETDQATERQATENGSRSDPLSFDRLVWLFLQSVVQHPPRCGTGRPKFFCDNVNRHPRQRGQFGLQLVQLGAGKRCEGPLASEHMCSLSTWCSQTGHELLDAGP